VWRCVDGGTRGPGNAFDLVVKDACCLEYVVRPLDVHIQSSPRVIPRGVGQQGREVNDVGRISLLDGTNHVGRLGDIAASNRHVVGDAQLREDVVVRRDVVGHHVVAVVHEVLDHVRAEEAGSASNEYRIVCHRCSGTDTEQNKKVCY
jgi:hypothetical protein